MKRSWPKGGGDLAHHIKYLVAVESFVDINAFCSDNEDRRTEEYSRLHPNTKSRTAIADELS